MIHVLGWTAAAVVIALVFIAAMMYRMARAQLRIERAFNGFQREISWLNRNAKEPDKAGI